MKKINLSIALVIILITLISCKKNNTGGEAVIVTYPQFNGKNVFGATAYIKFGATSAPSDPVSNYNLKIVGEPKEEHIHIEDMRYGKYYVYTVGYDSLTHQTVRGGMGIEIKWSDRKKEKDLIIPVTQ